MSRALVEMVRSGATARRVEATLVFADVSGFTPLTERFDRRGRDGSELLTDLLNELFAPTLDAGLDLGGDLLKFGGDALLLAFDGAGHAERGLSAAVAMQRTLQGAARRRRVAVGMSVGVATGPVSLQVAGRLHPELLVAGPTVDRCLRCEAAAAQGEVLVDLPEEVLAAVGATVSPNDHGIVVSALARPVPGAVADGARTADPGADLVDPLVSRAVLEGAAAEHRRAVVCFVHFDIGAGADEVTWERLGELVDAIEEAARAHQVCVLNCDVDVGGGKFTLTAGVPTTTGDDADRLLLCALRIAGDHRAPGVRIGLNEGRCFAGPVGSGRRRAYTIMGDAVNVGARVMGQAAHGQVLAATPVLARTRQLFDTEAVPPFHVKGKVEPLTAAVVRAATGGFRGNDDAVPMQGRSTEVLHIAGLVAGGGAVIEVVGEAGIGKSRLLAEVTSSRGALALECGRYLAQSAYGTVVEAARRWLGGAATSTEDELAARLLPVVTARAPALLPWLPLAAVPLGIDLPDTTETAAIGDEFRARRVHQAFGDLLLALSEGPRLVSIEDTHWLDEATGALLDAVLPRLVDAGWSLVVTRRPDPTGWRPMAAHVIDLAPLDPAATAALVRELTTATPVSERVARELAERSQGNPLFVEELVRAVADGRSIDELPDRVEVLIEARIDELDVPRRRLLRAASVLGMRFEEALLDALAPSPPGTFDGLSEFLVRADGVRFRHALFRDTAYLALPVRERRRLHAAAARAIEDRSGGALEELAEQLGVHWHRAGEPRRALPYLRQAARRSRSDSAPAEAAWFLEQALECGRRPGVLGPEERAAIEEELGVLYDTLGRFDDAERRLRSARRRVADPAERARLRGWEGRVARSARSLRTAAARFRRALAEAPPEAAAVRAELLVGLCSVLERQGRRVEKIGPLLEAIAAAEAGGDAATAAHAHLLLGNTYGDLGDPRGVEHLQIALRHFDQLGDAWGVASSRNNLGVETYYAGDWVASIEHYRAGLEAYRRLGDETNTAMALNNIGEIHSDQGRWDEARREFDEARRVWTACGFPLGAALATSNLGRLAYRVGDLDEAASELDAAEAGFREIDAGGFLLEVEARRCALDLVARRPDACLDRATALLDSSADELQPTVRCGVLRVAALAAGACGATSRAGRLLTEAVAVASSVGATYELAACGVADRELGGGLAGDLEGDAAFDRLGVQPAARRPW